MTEARITPDEVLAAYAKTGMKPIFMFWWSDNGCCCPVAVLHESIGAPAGGCIHWANKTYGDDYVESFIAGVDGCPEIEGFGDTCYADGRAVRQAIVEAGLMEAVG